MLTTNDVVGTLQVELARIRDAMVAAEVGATDRISSVPAEQRSSAVNLLHYVALRQHDARSLQERLSTFGLSSLGRAEPHVLASLDAVSFHLDRLEAQRDEAPRFVDPCRFEEGRALLRAHADALLSAGSGERTVRIMATVPSEAADDYALVRDLVAAGMDCMRVNCAHDDAPAWAAMIANLRRAERECGRTCRVLMDLAGPKLRTGPLVAGPGVVKIRPRRDRFGRLTEPAHVWLRPAGDELSSPLPADAVLPLASEWLASVELDDEIHFRDARGARRRLTIVGATGVGWWAECDRTTYIVPGTTLRLRRGKRRGVDRVVVGPLDTPPEPITLRPGDTLVLTRSLDPGRDAARDKQERVIDAARIGCTLPEVFGAARVGDRVWLDDGKIGGHVEAVNADELWVRIDVARKTGERLRAEKGINLPDTVVPVSAMTAKDREDLAFIAANADIVGLSFVRSADDVEELHARLTELGQPRVGVVLKIETRQGFEALPELMLAAMRFPSAGVMIARGDLAVECGYERLAEVQEEILWVAEAAHMPVIWATQVLETLTKRGQPTRAEVTDAAMGVRAECVMLNKGPYLVDAVRVLDDILTRMRTHQDKKRSLLRRLRAWHA